MQILFLVLFSCSEEFCRHNIQRAHILLTRACFIVSYAEQLYSELETHFVMSH
jgi:hypothetical protein